MPPVTYELLSTDGRARMGVVRTPHGSYDTPAFMPVGTRATVKGLLPHLVKETGAGCVLANTYHLLLRPGSEVVRDLGGLHEFMAWDGAILTDSGGFQVFSLSAINRIDDDGVTFTSHVDGQKVRLTPEASMRVQNDLGADVIMAFDECPPSTAPGDVQRRAVERTVAWLERCVRAHAKPEQQALFGIVQGGLDLDLRRECADRLRAFDLPGYAVGGLAVGEGFDEMLRVLDATVPHLPADRPRYLMGVGYPRDLVAAVQRGVDQFDCVLPTRNGRTGNVFTASGVKRLRNAKYARDAGPIQEGCDCLACRSFSLGALRHYFLSGEMLGPMLASLHNVRFYQRLMADVRQAVAERRLDAFAASDSRAALGPAR